MHTTLVIGGGITGRLFQAAVPSAQVFDWGPAPTGQPTLTRQFGTNYLWAPLEGLECRELSVLTEVDGKAPTDAAIRAYKQKIGKGWEQTWGTQFAHAQTAYDLVSLPESRVEYNMRAVAINPIERRVVWSNGTISFYDTLVSTIPLYALIQLLKESELGQVLAYRTQGQFRFDPIFVKVTTRPPDAKARGVDIYVNYNSDPDVPVYRTCDRDGSRHYESLISVGQIPTRKIVPGKIHAIDPDITRGVHALLGSHHIHCFGRFATWDPEELVHQTHRRILDFRKEMNL